MGEYFIIQNYLVLMSIVASPVIANAVDAGTEGAAWLPART